MNESFRLAAIPLTYEPSAAMVRMALSMGNAAFIELQAALQMGTVARSEFDDIEFAKPGQVAEVIACVEIPLANSYRLRVQCFQCGGLGAELLQPDGACIRKYDAAGNPH